MAARDRLIHCIKDELHQLCRVRAEGAIENGRIAVMQLAGVGAGCCRKWAAGVVLVAAMLLAAASAAWAGDPNVEAAQRKLRSFGYEIGQPDGVVGPKTREAIRAFQAAAELPVTGELDSQTLSRLVGSGPASAPPASLPAQRSSEPVAASPAPPQSALTPAAPLTTANPVVSQPPAVQTSPLAKATTTSPSNDSSSVVWLFVVAVIAIIIFIAHRRAARRDAAIAAARPVSIQAIIQTTDKSLPASPPIPASNKPSEEFGKFEATGISIHTSNEPPRRDRTSRPRTSTWLQAGQRLKVANLSITCGMLYVGTAAGYSHGGEENCVIDPSLPVARSQPDIAGASLPYYPSYSQITPAARLAYLTWLQEGRKDPSANIGYVFLYFYGLERRLVVDGAGDEAPAIVAELERLLGIYGGNNSFARYCGELLDVTQIICSGDSFGERPPTSQARSWEVPLALRVALGRRVAAGRPLDAEWMLAWLLADPDQHLRTPARRAPKEFAALFASRFQAKYPNGMAVKPPKTRLKPTYKLSSGYLQVPLPIGDIPDLTSIEGPLNQAGAIAQSCVADLDSYSRFLGRNPDKAGTLEAALLLPEEIQSASDNAALKVMAGWLGRTTQNGPALVPTGDLLSKLGMGQAVKVTRRDALRIAEALGRFGYGMEPDPAFGTGVPHPSKSVCLFMLGEQGAREPSPGYGGMTLVVSLAVSLARADGQVTEVEARAIRSRVEASALPDAEKSRLDAHLLRLSHEGAALDGLKARLASLPEAERREVAEFALAVTSVDGHVDPAEVRALQRLYGYLGLDKERVFSDLHSRAASIIDEPVTVTEQSASGGFRVPKPATPATEPVAGGLDADRLSRILAETQRVSAVLGAVFQEEESQSSGEDAEDEPDEASDEGDGETGREDIFALLDPQHRGLVVELLKFAEWEPADYERLARSMDLMPEGALEVINEWAFERFDEALVELGDPITVNQGLVPPRVLEEAA